MLEQRAHQMASDTTWKQEIESLETALATPLIPGELTDWIQTVKQFWEIASQTIHKRASELHSWQLQQIGSQDPSLLSQVERLQREGEALLREADEFGRLLDHTAHHATKLERDGTRTNDFLEKLADRGLALIIRVRKQEVALETWFVEAFNRDRGAVD